MLDTVAPVAGWHLQDAGPGPGRQWLRDLPDTFVSPKVRHFSFATFFAERVDSQDPEEAFVLVELGVVEQRP
jgi:hypothetical protein